MESDQILITKLMIPATPHRVVARPRLACAAEPARVTLISAPAGYGKTVLMANWAGSGKLPAAWLSLDAADNDPVRFLLHFIGAVQTVIPHLGTAIAESLQSQQPPAAVAAAQLLINRIGAVGREWMMVLDDYHVVSDAAVHEVVELIIRHQPPQLRLMIGSRSDMPFSLSRLRAQGHLREIGPQDLRFTRDEAALFLREGMELTLADDEVCLLESRTEGWVAGMQLAALSLKKQPDKAAFLKKFSGDNAHISEFLIDEVLQLQSRETEDFLLRTSIFERFCPALCDAVTGRTDSAAMIDTLERQNLFLVRLDAGQRWYRYHHLFAALLVARLDALLPDETAVLHRRAALWYSEHDLQQEAMEHAFKAHDYELAADLMQRHGYDLSSHGRTGAILAWAKLLPPASLAARPALCLTCAWSSFFVSDLIGLDHYIEKAERYLSLQRQPPYSEQEQVMLGQVALLRSCQKRYEGRCDDAMRLAQHAASFFSEGRVLHGAALGCVAICHLTRGEVELAIAAFEKIADVSPKQRNFLVPLTAVLGLARSYLVSGRLRQAELVYEKALRQCTERGWQDLPVCGLVHIGLGELAYEWNDLARAEKSLSLGVQMTSKGVQYISDWGSILLEQTRLALGKRGKGFAAKAERQLLKYLGKLIIDIQRPSVALIKLWLLQGRLDAVGRWIDGRGFDIDRLQPENEPEYLLLVRWLLAQQRTGDAQAWIERLLPPAQAAGRMGAEIDLLILHALAQQASGAMQPAIASLEQALRLASPQRYARIFLDEGAPLSHLLQRLTLAGRGTAYTSYLLGCMPAAVMRTTAALPDLSAKEYQVVQLFLQDFSNQQIADTLFVSLNTVKTHLKNIYKKLGAHNREQAVRCLKAAALS